MLTDESKSPLDLTTCDREPIRTPGSIQPHGVLLVLSDREMRVSEASANAEYYIGLAAERVLGAHMKELLDPERAQHLESLIESANLTESPMYLQTLPAVANGRFFHVIAHRFGGKLIIELERTETQSSASFGNLYPVVSTLVSRLKKVPTVEAISSFAADEVRRLTGFDRVLIYKFDRDWNGQVIGEARDLDYSSYLDLWFPASDIPKQARELYALNRLRSIADVNYRPVPILSQDKSESAKPLDLSFSIFRSVSPIHIEYLKNMGVMSSMSISLLTGEGRLWGLIACHHRSAKVIPLELRTACDLIAQTVSTQLEFAEQKATYERRIRLTSTTSRLVGFMAQEDDFLRGLTKTPEELLAFGGASGVAILYGGEFTCWGSCPEEKHILRLVDWLILRGRENIYYTDCLSTEMPDGDALRELASGVLAISISKLYSSYILWFRPEVLQTVKWSGDPRKSVESVGGMPDRLHPRKSFETWKEIVRGRSLAWDPVEIDLVGELRNSIIGVVLKKAEELAGLSAELQRSNQELEAFSYSVSHDLRAPFRHILGYSELLKSSTVAKLDDKDQRYIDIIIRSATFAGTLVENLLSFSQLGRAKLKLRRIEMDRLVRDVRRDLEAETEGRSVIWKIGALPQVECDAILIRLVWQNLLQNALKFTKYRQQPSIEIDSNDEKDEVVFSVRDNGIGFEQNYAEKLFGVFERLHRAEDFGGTGIGLANVKRIVSRHGGRVWAKGEPDVGAIFCFSLPKKVSTV